MEIFKNYENLAKEKLCLDIDLDENKKINIKIANEIADKEKINLIFEKNMKKLYNIFNEMKL